MRVRAVLKLDVPGEPEGEPTLPACLAAFETVEVELVGELPAGYVRSLAVDVESLRGGWDRMLVFPFSLVELDGEMYVKREPDEPSPLDWCGA